MARTPTIRVKVDTKGLGDARANLQRMIRSVTDMRPMMEDIGDSMVQRIQERFVTGKSPSGRKLPKAQDGTTLVDSGRMRDSISADAERRKVTIGTDAFYAGFVHFGTKNMPARPFIGNDKGNLAAGDRRTIRNIVMEHVMQWSEGDNDRADLGASAVSALRRLAGRK